MSDKSSQPATNLRGKDFVERLRKSLRRDGDFPASARVVSELKKLASEPDTTANKITELILREPSLGTRVLHLVNSSFYKRSKPIMTVSQAVVQIGMRPLAELCSGLVLMQKFAPRARDGGAFANSLQQTVTTSLLASSLATEIAGAKSKSKDDETGYLAGTFYELGALLLAYYFPKVYDNAIKRAESKGVEISQGIFEITGLTPVGLSLEIIDELRLPEFYVNLLKDTEAFSNDQGSTGGQPAITKTLYAAHEISSAIVEGDSKDELDQKMARLRKKCDLGENILHKAVGNLSQAFKDQCHSLELPLPDLPHFIKTYNEEKSPTSETKIIEVETPEDVHKFAAFIDEIQEAVDNREPTSSVITSVMETLAWSLMFDRVILMLLDKKRNQISGRMVLGNIPNFNPQKFSRPIGKGAGPYAADARALEQSRAIFQGDPYFDDGWPIAVLPVGFDEHSIGVIYADRIDADSDELDGREQAAIGVLAELLDKSVSMNT